MGKKETKAVDKLISSSSGRLKLFKIENTIGSAMPDLIGENRSGKSFWLEAKHLDAWPKRESTFPLKGAFEKGQQAWSKAWISWNGNAFLFLRVGEIRTYHYFLIEFTRDDLELKTQLELMTLTIREGIENIIDFLENL